MREQTNEKNEKTEVVPKKWRKQRKAGKIQQVIDGGGVQLGTSRGQGGANRARSEKRSKYVYKALRSAGGISHPLRLLENSVKRTEKDSYD